MGTNGDLADKAIMSIYVTENPATAVEMHYDWQQAFAVFWENDAHADSTFVADRKCGVLDMCIGLRSRDRLLPGQYGASIRGRHRVNRRTACGHQIIDEPFSNGIEGAKVIAILRSS
jgi:hypothetical protein